MQAVYASEQAELDAWKKFNARISKLLGQSLSFTEVLPSNSAIY